MKKILLTGFAFIISFAALAQTKSKIDSTILKTKSNTYKVIFVNNSATFKHKSLPLEKPKPADARPFEFMGETLNRPMLIDMVARLMNKHREKVNWDKLDQNFTVEITLYVHPITKKALYASFYFRKNNFNDLTFFEDLERELQNSDRPMTMSPSGTLPVFIRYGYFKSGIGINWLSIKDKLEFK